MFDEVLEVKIIVVGVVDVFEVLEYYVELVVFECGMFKLVDRILEIECFGEVNESYEGKDLNIVFGIYKSYDICLRSSLGSFNGLGLF